MTSRELLAVVALAAPVVALALVALVPRRLVIPVAVVAGIAAGALALALAAVALVDSDDPTVGRWLVLDAAGGLLIAVVGAVGVASVLASPAYLGTAAGRPVRTYFVLLFAFWALLLAVPLAGNLGVAWLLVEATTAPSALLVGYSGQGARARGRLEVPDPHLARARRRAARDRVPRGRRSRAGSARCRGPSSAPTPPGSETALVAYLLLLAGLAAKIGWAPVHNWLPDAHSEAPAPVSALLSAALLPSVLLVAWRSEQALAPVIGGPHGAGGADRLRARLARGRGAVPLARARVEAAARVLEPRAHGRDRARDRLRLAARARRRRRAHRRARDREGARLLRGHAADRARAARGRPRRHRHRPHAAEARRVARHLAGNARGPAAVAAVRQRGADRRRRLPGRLRLGGRRRDRAARARLPRARARAARDDGREGAPPRDAARSRACAA